MAVLDRIQAKTLSVQLIARVERDFAQKLGLRNDQISIGLLTADNDDANNVEVEQATNM